MGGRLGRVAVVVALVAPALLVPMTATAKLETADIAIVEPQPGERFSDEFTLAWDLETDVVVDDVDLRLEYLCPQTDEIHVVTDMKQPVVAEGPQTLTVDPAADGPSGGLPDCDDVQLRLFVVPTPTGDVLRDTVSVVLDRRDPEFEMQIEDYKQAKGEVSLSWADDDGNEVPTVLTAVDAETDSVLEVRQGLEDTARETIDLNATPLAGPWEKGSLLFTVDCEETLDRSCRPGEVPIPSPSQSSLGIRLQGEAKISTRIEATPDGECQGSKRVQGSVEAESSAIDTEDAIERVEVLRTVDGEDRTGGVYVPADPGPDGRWSSFVYDFVCSDAGVHEVRVRPVFEGGIPGDPESDTFTLTPPTTGTYEDLSIERVDASACDGNATARIEVVGSVSGVHLVEGLFGGETWDTIGTVSDPVAMADIADETDVRFPAKADAAFRHRVDCPGPGTHELKIRALTVADSTETWEKLIEIGAAGGGGGIELDVGAGATRVEDLAGDKVRAHFNAEALGTASRRGGLKQLAIDFEGDPGDARLAFAPDVEVPPVGEDLVIVETFDLHVEDGEGREIPVVRATLEYETTLGSLARAAASFDDPRPVLADRDPDEGRWRMVEAASVTDTGEGEIVRFEMTGDDLFSPFAMTYGPASSEDGDPWSGLRLGDVLDGLSGIAQVVFVAVVGLAAVVAGVVAARLVGGGRPPFG